MLTCLFLAVVGPRCVAFLSGVPVIAAATQRAQMMMFAGFVLLGWILARRTIAARRRHRATNRTAAVELRKIRDRPPRTVGDTSLADAPAEVQRWQSAMHDLTRDMAAELETRVGVAQTLINQLDAAAGGAPVQRPVCDRVPIAGAGLVRLVREGIDRGRSVESMAEEAGVDCGEIRWTIAAITPGAKVQKLEK